MKKIEFSGPKMWMRFKTINIIDFTYLEIEGWDAICFKPLKDVFFFGFGVFGSYEKLDMKIKVSWEIDRIAYPEFSVVNIYSDKDPEKKWFVIDIRKFGVKPIKVSEGTEIHCKMRCESTDYALRRAFYGENGTRAVYSTIEG